MDISRLRARRREARRHQRLARVDVGLGVIGALVLLLATPGLAITAIVALAVLALCLLSVVLERRALRRSKRVRAPRNARPPAANGSRARDSVDASL